MDIQVHRLIIRSAMKLELIPTVNQNLGFQITFLFRFTAHYHPPFLFTQNASNVCVPVPFSDPLFSNSILKKPCGGIDIFSNIMQLFFFNLKVTASISIWRRRRFMIYCDQVPGGKWYVLASLFGELSCRSYVSGSVVKTSLHSLRVVLTFTGYL